MSVVLSRLLFLAFVGLTGFITYNALYLQDQRPVAELPTVPKGAGNPQDSATQLVGRIDLPPLPARNTSSQLVTAIQRELTVRGYGGGPANGKLREETRKAIAAFEKDHGLPVSGSPSDELLRRILLGETASPSASTSSVAGAAKGEVGPSSASTVKQDWRVKQVQQILADLGYAPGPIDGALGSATGQAMKAFQRDRKIAETGRISPELLREIRRVTGRDLTGVASRQ